MTTDPQTDRFRKRPVEIEARQLLGSDDGEPAREIARWCGGWLGSTFREPKLVIPTLEGDMTARPGDWVVRGVKGEFYPVRADIFAETYEPASVPSAPVDRAAVLREAAQHLYTALFPAVYDDMGQKAAEGVNRAVSELRRMADEEQPEETVRCPLCPDARPLRTPTEARAHFATAHPEERLVGSGPWPLLANRADEEQQPETQRDALMQAHVALAAQAGRDQATIARVRRLHDNLDAETDLTSPDDPITRGAAAKRIAAALDGWTACGRTKSVADTEYPPCGRPAGHEEAYCRSADGKQYFLAVNDAPAAVPCNAVHLHVHHTQHQWEPQPGMDRIPCAGYPAAAPQPGKEA